MPTIDQTVTIVRDEEWQYVRIPLSVQLPEGELRLHRHSLHGPITLSQIPDETTAEKRTQDWQELFRLLDEAHAAGETFELERDFCPPRDVAF